MTESADDGVENVSPLATMDWGVGQYEVTAEQLLPVAHEVLAVAGVRAGERVVDLGCGSGNASLLAARQGARVTGVDPTARLRDVARGRAASEGLDIAFVAGDATALPLDDASADVVLSVSVLDFVPDPVATAAEVARVLAPAGRIVFTAWHPDGPIRQLTTMVADAVRQAVGAPPAPERFAWQDPDALSALFEPHGRRVTIVERSLAYVGPSAREYLDRQLRTHPLAITSLALLDQAGQGDALRARALDMMESANEDPAGFRIMAPYVIATVR